MHNKVIWMTGLSGAGKTTIAMAASKRFGCEVLDGDTIRNFFQNSDFSREGRERHLLGVARMANMISKHTSVICSFITPYESTRERILEILPEGSIMAHVSTSLEVCEDRDVKGLYAKARAGQIKEFTGISSPYEAPETPELKIETGKQDLADSVELVIKALLERGVIPAA